MKALVRSGIPHEFRARVWGALVHGRTHHERAVAGEGYYSRLLKEKKGAYSPSAKQIELDLLRTLPNNKYYDTLESEGVSLSYPLNMYLKGRKLGGIKLGG